MHPTPTKMITAHSPAISNLAENRTAVNKTEMDIRSSMVMKRRSIILYNICMRSSTSSYQPWGALLLLSMYYSCSWSFLHFLMSVSFCSGSKQHWFWLGHNSSEVGQCESPNCSRLATVSQTVILIPKSSHARLVTLCATAQ